MTAEIKPVSCQNSPIPPGEGILVSVVVVCYNSRTWLPQCLDSIQKQTLFRRSEVILVDNASKDGTEQLARELTVNWSNAEVIQTGGNVGFGAASNRGVGRSQGKYIYLINPDAWFETDCLEQFYLTAEREKAGCVGGLILEYEDNRVQARGCIGFDFCGNGVEPRKNSEPDRLFFFHGFFFIRKELYLRLGSLDEKFFLYAEEPDLCWRIWISGDKIVPAPGARAHHRGSAFVNPAGGGKIVENRTSTNTRFLANRNRLLVVAKNCQHVLLFLLLPCTALVIVEGIFVLLMTRNPAIAKKSSLDAFADFWCLRHHVLAERKRIRSFRRRSDFWMMRFFRLGFGRSHELKAILKRGFPKFNRP